MSARRERERRREESLAREERETGSKRRGRTIWLGGGVAVLAILGAALAVGAGRSGSAGSAAPLTKAEIASTPKRLAANEAQANDVIDAPLAAKLESLRGAPVVVNQWASWCPSCRAEFPFFQALGKRLRGQVAFVGLDSDDDRGSAEEFLESYPVNYPSIYDHDVTQALSIGAGEGWPTTVFYDRRGRQTYVHLGGYASLASLRADVERYALAPG
jgi:thiol-disulfide isomerase/thioredoxin